MTPPLQENWEERFDKVIMSNLADESRPLIYHEDTVKEIKSFISTLLKETKKDVYRKIDEYEYHKDEIHCTCLAALRDYLQNGEEIIKP